MTERPLRRDRLAPGVEERAAQALVMPPSGAMPTSPVPPGRSRTA